ncbi:hypothetical protein A2773_06450 [Candidatus Gottesmanbacteria bacterium RIFCSPHIGHO2_01_FULL_39_10]|uniref:Uncharacterized protein n=1 Tax=Candidatus Gottesmanbacteria bacterium RIFCSPHIGHO2_01_FULL_39_10 TaxID=1798375 RepID=A0A1F5ZPI2_9BACT|nr:MAG: hypothetical protein A2773_06450 [Candidatus Gottesmanbacteria bacterium RIFCSPHIGHO2_01_FULL_39_10]
MSKKESLLYKDFGELLKKRFQFSLFNLLLILISIFIVAFFAGSSTAGVFQLNPQAFFRTGVGTEQGGFVLFAPTLTPVPTVPVNCQICEETGCPSERCKTECVECEAKPSPTPTTPVNCKSCEDAGCPAGRCKTECVKCGAEPTPTPTKPVNCQKCVETGCPTWQCYNQCSACTEPPPGASPTGTKKPKPTKTPTPGSGTPSVTKGPTSTPKPGEPTEDPNCDEWTAQENDCGPGGNQCRISENGYDWQGCSCSLAPDAPDTENCDTNPGTVPDDAPSNDGVPVGGRCTGSGDCSSGSCDQYGSCVAAGACAGDGQTISSSKPHCCAGTQTSGGSGECKRVSGGGGAGGSCPGDCATSAQNCRNLGGNPSGSGGCPAGVCCN